MVTAPGMPRDHATSLALRSILAEDPALACMRSPSQRLNAPTRRLSDCALHEHGMLTLKQVRVREHVVDTFQQVTDAP